MSQPIQPLEYEIPPQPRTARRISIYFWLPAVIILVAGLLFLAVLNYRRATVARVQRAAAAAAIQQIGHAIKAYQLAAIKPATLPTIVPTTRSPVAAIWSEGGYPKTVARDQLIIGVWSDGAVVWSHDLARGGEPYMVASVDPIRVRQLIDDLDRAGFFDESRQVNAGPDAGYTVLAARMGEKQQLLGSWHDPPPTNPNVIVTEQGMTTLVSGQSPPKPSAEYQRFLDAWSRARRLMQEIIPPTGSPARNVHLDVYKQTLSRQPQ